MSLQEIAYNCAMFVFKLVIPNKSGLANFSHRKPCS